jgi:hypothetical protein
MGQLDSGNSDGRIVERLEAGHRGTAPLDRAMVRADGSRESVPSLLALRHVSGNPEQDCAVGYDDPAFSWHAQSELVTF